MKRNGKRFVKKRAGLIQGLEEFLPDLLKKVREWKGMGRTSRLALHRKEEKRKCIWSCAGKRFVKGRVGLMEGLEEALPDLLKKGGKWNGMGSAS